MSSDKRKSRRTLLKAMGAGAVSLSARVPGLAQEHAGHAKAAPERAGGAAYKPRFFTAAEYATVDAVAARIIPSDETPGAREAGVAEFIDSAVLERAELHAVYREGIAWLDGRASAKHRTRFARLPASRQDAILRELAAVKKPAAENEVGIRFFRSVRALTIDGFYSSRIGLKELGYSGNTFLTEFKGCTHPEHGA